jgi:glutathione S-transferase
MSIQIELHGRMACPFAWRTRLAATEKGVTFEYIPHDAPQPDPRAAERNPDQRSPLLIHGDVRLTESIVIAQYIDEAFPGRALVPSDPVERARMRTSLIELVSKLEADARDGVVATPEVRARAASGYQLVDQKLADGRPWLGGDAPLLSDLVIWPNLAALDLRLAITIPAAQRRTQEYWERARQRPSYRQTRPEWANRD